MWERYKPAVIVAGLLFVVDAIGGILTAGWLSKHETWTGFWDLAMIGLIMAVAGFIWSRQYPLARVVPDVLLATTIGCVLSAGLVPLIAEITRAAGHSHWQGGQANPFGKGAGSFFAQIWVFYGVALVSALVGWMVTVALGVDQRSKALKQFTKTVMTKPHRPVRR